MDEAGGADEVILDPEGMEAVIKAVEHIRAKADEVILDPEGMEAVIKAVEHIRAKINKPLVHAVSESLIKTMASMNAANADRVMIVAMVFATQMMDAPPLMREAMFGAVVILAGEVMEFMEAADLKAAASAPLAEREAEGNG